MSLECKSSKDQVKHKVVTFRDYKNFNQTLFLNDLSSNECITEGCLQNDDLCNKWDSFKSAFLEISDRHAPVKSLRLKDRFNPWIDNNIVKLMYKRDYIKEQAVVKQCPILWNEYKQIRNNVTNAIKTAKKEYYSQEVLQCGNDPKKMWKFVNKVTKSKCHQKPPDDLSANVFNDYFATIGKNTANSIPAVNENIPWKGLKSNHRFIFNVIEIQEVNKLLIKLGSDSGIDVLGFDVKLLNLGAHVISSTLTSMFNASLNTSIIPSDWKLARVTPVYKGKGDKYTEGNYRPISVIGHIAKLFERNVQKQLVCFLIENKYMSIDQSAYRKAHNTQTSLHRVVDDWIDNICDDLYTGVCLLDIKKCFDTIDHKILMEKMSYYGIFDKELKWFESYLKNRSQIVSCNGQTSDLTELTIGVPQGSVLGPILFTLFVNDLNQHVHTGTANLYADDTLIYCSGKTTEDVTNTLQTCINDVSTWYGGNRLALNSNKSQTMLIASKHNLQNCDQNLNISLYNNLLEQVNSTEYLGVKIDQCLNWKDHMDKASKSLSFKVNRMSRLSSTAPTKVVMQMYNSIIQPSFDYAITVWGNTTSQNIGRLQRLQNRAARIVKNNFDYINHRGIDLVHGLGWMDIKQRCKYFQCVLMFKSIHGIAPDYLVNNITMEIEVKNVNTRSHDMNVYVPFSEKEFAKNKFEYSGAKYWNDLPGYIKECSSLFTFKSKLKSFIKSKYF